MSHRDFYSSIPGWPSFLNARCTGTSSSNARRRSRFWQRFTTTSSTWEYDFVTATSGIFIPDRWLVIGQFLLIRTFRALYRFRRFGSVLREETNMVILFFVIFTFTFLYFYVYRGNNQDEQRT